jgi:hypothetical protein
MILRLTLVVAAFFGGLTLERRRAERELSKQPGKKQRHDLTRFASLKSR